VTVGLLEETNVFEWDDGSLHLISDASGKGSEFDGTTPSGGDAFFSAWGQLVPPAVLGYAHLYDARVDGGFPTEVAFTNSCAGEICRPSGASSTTVSPSASASIGEGGVEPGSGPPRPKFTVAKITAAQRSLLARNGIVTLRVSATAPGALVARATARLHGRSTRVAQARAMLARSGEVGLTLRLSTAARAALLRRKTLNLRIEVSYGTTGTADLVRLTLRAPSRRHISGRSARRA
jgi:hypothetical protein